jgi:hypothetical protein
VARASFVRRVVCLLPRGRGEQDQIFDNMGAVIRQDWKLSMDALGNDADLSALAGC